MNIRSKTGIEILQVALAIGVLGDILLRQMPWGLNVLLFNLAFVAGTIVLLLRRKPEYLTPQTWALLGAQVFFAAMFVWRDSDQLHVADSFAIIATMSVLLVPRMKIPPRVAGVFHYIVGFLWSTLNAGFAAFALFGADIDWKSHDRSRITKNAIAVFRGLLLVTPLILVFGALFMAADAAYEGLVERTLNIDLSRVVSHIVIFSVFAWATAGYLRGLVIAGGMKFAVNPTNGELKANQTGRSATVMEHVGRSAEGKVADLENDTVETSFVLPGNASVLEHINRSDPPKSETDDTPKPESKTGAKTEARSWPWPNFDSSFLPSAFTLGSVEIGVILGLLNLLFLSFVVVQIPYLFGGMDLVQNTPDFKLAEYARRGFGELVAVSALVLPMLLISHWLVRKDDRFAGKLYSGLASIQIVLLFVIMASAVQRLVLLTGPVGYGMTTIRLYPMIFMTWLGLVFVWFVLTVLRGQRKYFAWGALWSAFFILGATHFLNPDEFIVRTNIKLMQQGRDFDTNYNASLSSDATPALLESFSLFNDPDGEVIIRRLAKQQCRNKVGTDFRDWNFSRWQATQALKGLDHVLLDKIGGCALSSNDLPQDGDH